MENFSINAETKGIRISVIVFENNEYRIAFKTDNKNNVVWSE